MKKIKLKFVIGACLVYGSIVLLACNNSDYTKNPPATPDNSANAADTTANKMTSDTTMNTPASNSSTTKAPTTSTKKQMATSPKKRRVSVGTMATKNSSAMKPDKNGVYDMTEIRPQFPGGQSALDDYVNNNIDLQGSFDDNIGGTVDVQFVIDENGKVKDAKAIGNRLGNGLDEAAVQVVSNMPNWTPGKVKGKNVKTRVVLPISYQTGE